jgi:hypothetical protein
MIFFYGTVRTTIVLLQSKVLGSGNHGVVQDFNFYFERRAKNLSEG